MNINGMFAGTNEEFESFLNELLKIIEEDECDCNDCCGCTDECVDMCWDEAIREILKQEEKEEVERAKPVEIAINDVIYSGPATIIKWNDGTKTIVKCEPDEEYNMEKGFVMAYMKKLLGDKKFFKELKKWVWKNPRANFDQKNKERQKAQGKKIKAVTVEGLNGSLETLEDTVGTVATDDAAATGLIKSVGNLEEIVGKPAEGETAATGLVEESSKTEPVEFDQQSLEDMDKAIEDVCGFLESVGPPDLELESSEPPRTTPIGDITKVTPVTCTCGAEYEAAAELQFTSCPECGVVTKIDDSVQ